MKTSKYIDTCIERIQKVLGDANNELTSGQRRKLERGISGLKKLRKATRLDRRKLFRLVAEIAEAAYEVLTETDA